MKKLLKSSVEVMAYTCTQQSLNYFLDRSASISSAILEKSGVFIFLGDSFVVF